MTHETAKEWAARPGAVVRYWHKLSEEWRLAVPEFCPARAYAIYDGHRNVLVSIGHEANEPDVGSQMLEALGAPKDASITIVRDGEVVPKSHPLQADIVKWAGDPERWGWQFRDAGGWIDTVLPPTPHETVEFRIIERHAPKGPLTEAPEMGTRYWVARPSCEEYATKYKWRGDDTDLLWLSRGFCFRTREEAAALGRRMAEVAKENGS